MKIRPEGAKLLKEGWQTRRS